LVWIGLSSFIGIDKGHGQKCVIGHVSMELFGFLPLLPLACSVGDIQIN